MVVLSAILADLIGSSDPFEPVGPPLASPTWAFPMGTDDLGRDLLSGVVHGLRTSLVLAVAVTVLASVLGVAIGSVAGYFGGLVDDVLMRILELVQVVPRFFLAVLVAAMFGPGLDNLILVLGLTSWPWLSRVVRAEVLSLREREFVEAARSLGTSEASILVREVLPAVIPATVVMAGLVASSAILIEAGIGFLGLADPAVVSLGSLSRNAQGFLRVAWWMAVFPGIAIGLVTVGINLVADSVNDALNPRTRFVLGPHTRSAPPRPGVPAISG